ncbi:hypothetical protein [Jiella sonneratiae]|nr:hypothetical protein [Jiella sonneratiae]
MGALEISAPDGVVVRWGREAQRRQHLPDLGEVHENRQRRATIY